MNPRLTEEEIQALKSRGFFTSEEMSSMFNVALFDLADARALIRKMSATLAFYGEINQGYGTLGSDGERSLEWSGEQWHPLGQKARDTLQDVHESLRGDA